MLRNLLIPWLLILVAAASCGHTQPSRSYSALDEEPISGTWVELGAEGAVVVRTVAPGPNCPVLDTNLGQVPMEVRVAKSANFPATCEERLGPGVKSVILNGRALPLPPHRINRIIVIGDTGCRLEIQAGQPPQIQNCAADWPFAKIAATAARHHPDLVIHVGDYHYRESACPEGNAGCAGSVAGDVWGSWYQDFFRPAGDLLAAAPWVFVRGNHESCERAGMGYFRLIDPRPMPATACQDNTPPYIVDAGRGIPPLAVVDSSFADVTAGTLTPLAPFANRLERAGGGWLLTHRPPWIPVGSGANAKPYSAIVDEDNDEEAGENATIPKPVPAVGVPLGIDLALSGHRHVFEAMTFADRRAPLIIGGDGGTLLDTGVPTGDLTGAPVDTTTLTSWAALSRFGFLELEAKDTVYRGRKWRMTVYDPAGNVLKSCRLIPSRRRHAPVKPGAPEGMKLEC